MKSFAGLKLYGKKPRHAPESAAVKITTRLLPKMREMHKSVIEEIVATPIAKPSRPSMRLSALVMATIQRTVSGKPRKPSSTTPSELMKAGTLILSMTTPKHTGTIAASVCTQNLNFALRGLMSSNMPKTTIINAPNMMPKTDLGISVKMHTLTRNAMKIAKPPRRALGVLCIRRESVGTSTAPILYASFLTNGVAINATIKASKKENMVFVSEVMVVGIDKSVLSFLSDDETDFFLNLGESFAAKVVGCFIAFFVY